MNSKAKRSTPQFTVDFASRNLPGKITVTNAGSNPELTSDEGGDWGGQAVSFPEKVSARGIYTAGERDERLIAITDSKIVVYGEATVGTEHPDSIQAGADIRTLQEFLGHSSLSTTTIYVPGGQPVS